jgi:hypothetical protein
MSNYSKAGILDVQLNPAGSELLRSGFKRGYPLDNFLL